MTVSIAWFQEWPAFSEAAIATSVSGSCSPNAFWRLRAFSFSHSTGRKKPEREQAPA